MLAIAEQDLISGDGELWMAQRTHAYAAQQERSKGDGVEHQGGEGSAAAPVAAAPSLSAAARASVEANLLRGQPSTAEEFLIDPSLSASSELENGRSVV